MREIVCSDDVADKIFATGFKKPSTSLTIDDRGDLQGVLLDYNLMAEVKSEMDQFIKGLGTFNFINTLRLNPTIWKQYFVYMDQKLTAGKIHVTVLVVSILFYLFSIFKPRLKKFLHQWNFLKEEVFIAL